MWPAERLVYPDPATEFPVERLTDPANSSFLPPLGARAFARKSGFLIYASDRAGSFQLYRMQERTGESEQLTEAAALDPQAFTLAADDEGFCFCDGPVLHRGSLRTIKTKTLYHTPQGWRREPGLSLSPDGKQIALVESAAGRWRLRLIRTGSGRSVTLAEHTAPIRDPVAGPREQVLYICEDRLWLAGPRASPPQRLPIPDGNVLQACWAPDGRRLIYLLQPAGKAKLAEIREYEPTPPNDRLVAATSQFACFAVNGDSSVFLGASASVASPYLLLLLRVTRRELALCEHAARDPSRVRPSFSPDSRRVYFQSDREGKFALYRMNVERLVEPTDTQARVRSAGRSPV
ncbi:MAG: TolB family protein [Bryobacteraceae bacterium]